jgi:hypothetical protein
LTYLRSRIVLRLETVETMSFKVSEHMAL